jgi:hypothetical protein
MHISMPGYVDDVLKRFDHPWPAIPQHRPFLHVTPKYGQKYNMQQQMTIPPS